MDLSSDKREVLEFLLLYTKPVKGAELAKEMGKEFPRTQMHLIGLAKMELAQTPQKGQYLISEAGKEALGLPKTTQEEAKAILMQMTPEKTFHFYAGIDQPLNVLAHSLSEFCNKLGQVGEDSLEFHLNRGDFEAWFKSLGDVELAKKVQLIKEKQLRSKFRGLVEARCTVLSELTKSA
jgi:hypothetical protein